MNVRAAFDLTGRTALITGSSQGLGFAIARGLAQAGAAVVLNGRDKKKLAGILAQLGRSTLARNLAQHLGEAFARNIDARLRGPSAGADSEIHVGAMSLLLAARARLRAFLARLLGSRS